MQYKGHPDSASSWREGAAQAGELGSRPNVNVFQMFVLGLTTAGEEEGSCLL